MLKSLGDNNKIDKLREAIASNNNFVITCHISPDGDAVGSSLALCNLLQLMGKNASVITPDIIPNNLSFLPGAKDIVVFSRYEDFAIELINKADVIFSLDYNALYRVDRVGPYINNASAFKVMIDHHINPEPFADIVISHPDISSTCALLFKVLSELHLLQIIDKRVGECIFTGMMTDTGNFSYNSNDPELYYIIANLVALGVDKDYLYARVINSATESKIRITAYALDQKLTLYRDKHVALITLTRKELNDRHYKKGDTESLVNIPLKLDDIDMSFFLREETDYIKVSSRSKGDIPVNLICERYFNGGGHKNAAGGEFYGTMDECVKRFEEFIYNNEIINR